MCRWHTVVYLWVWFGEFCLKNALLTLGACSWVPQTGFSSGFKLHGPAKLVLAAWPWRLQVEMCCGYKSKYLINPCFLLITY